MVSDKRGNRMSLGHSLLRLSAFCLLAMGLVGAPAFAAKSAEDVYRDRANSVAVVVISDQRGEPVASGSAVVVGDRLLATNYHVVQGITEQSRLTVVLRSGVRMYAQVRAASPQHDLAILESDGPTPAAVPLGSTRKLAIGSPVYAIGAPLGLDSTLTTGIVSQLRSTESENVVQTNAAISPGSSGGGLFDSEGLLIGITTMKAAGGGAEGLTFAMPVEWVSSMLPSKKRGYGSFATIGFGLLGIVLLALVRPLSNALAEVFSSAGTAVHTPARAEVQRTHESPPAQPKIDYLELARQEQVQGKRDQSLWSRALSQASGDESLAKAAYIQARAVALRDEERDKLWQESVRTAKVQEIADRLHSRAAPLKKTDSETANDEPRGRMNRGVAAGVVFGGVCALAVALAFGIGWWTDDRAVPDPQPPIADSSPQQKTATDPAQPPSASRDDVRRVQNEDTFPNRIARFKEDRQWTLVVLHATEWTRKEPQNAIAWNELGIGHIELRQFAEAERAFRSALTIRPTSSVIWSNLGVSHWERSEARSAVLAFHEAVRLDPRDAKAFAYLGSIYLTYGKYADARVALDSALSVEPGNANALCGAGFVAYYERRFKDMQSLAAKLRPLDHACSARLTELVPRQDARQPIRPDLDSAPVPKCTPKPVMNDEELARCRERNLD
jgi:S1-C subfamily serine protease/cytochrome c-type biogenesis protein CcmH/NrfG